ncbi:MAG: hypothetical protein SVX38_11115 [Chloroflexota bacterium]|nr:hypothetical protein [Chloroflexota bacterium]
MSTERKLLIAFGAIIISGIIAIGAFSLGVYVGEQGWTVSAPAVTGPGAGLPQGGQPPPGAAPRREPDLIGPVQSLTDDGLTVETPQGPRMVTITEETRVLRVANGREEEARVEDLQRGMGVAIFGRFGDDGRTLVAEAVVILPPPQQKP